MNTLSRRLERLEAGSHGKGRFIALQTDCHHTNADVEATLRENGIRETPSDTVVWFKTVYLDHEGREQPRSGPPALLFVS